MFSRQPAVSVKTDNYSWRKGRRRIGDGKKNGMGMADGTPARERLGERTVEKSSFSPVFNSPQALISGKYLPFHCQ